MPVAHRSPAAVIGELVGMAAEQGGHLSLDGLRQQRSRAVGQAPRSANQRMPLAGRVGKHSLSHGVSLLRWRSGTLRTPPRYAALTLHAVTNFRE
jgi:hypothetical protein